MANCITCGNPLRGSDKSFTSTCTECVQKRPTRVDNEMMSLEQLLAYLESRELHAFSIVDPVDRELNRRAIIALRAITKR